MSRVNRQVILFLLAVLSTSCAGYEGAGSENIRPGYTIGGGDWNTGGGITAVVRVSERNGSLVVCGAWATDRQSALTALLNEDVMQAGSVYLDGTRVMQGLSFMAHVAYSDNITGAQADCVTSQVSWRASFAGAEPRLRFPRMAFAQDGGDEMAAGSGDATVFREGSRPNIIR